MFQLETFNNVSRRHWELNKFNLQVKMYFINLKGKSGENKKKEFLFFKSPVDNFYLLYNKMLKRVIFLIGNSI